MESQPVPETSESSTRVSDRAQLKRLITPLGWKLVGSGRVEVRSERVFSCGPRTIVVRGRVAVPLPTELTAAAGDEAVDAVIAPEMERLRIGLERAAAKVLTLPDDIVERHIYEHPDFHTAIEHAHRGMLRVYQELENRRLDDLVEADLGLRFYLESFTHQPRRLIYFVGPTNSGKTYAALQQLRAASSGVYLAPLRLLALEIFERLNEDGLPTSLITGEERILRDAARHVSSTVEMVDLGREVEVAVVDEVQMLQDEQRGWAWTLAIAGVRAQRIILCGSEEGLRAAQRLAERLGLLCQIERFERKQPLHVVDAIGLNDLRVGDAVVAFSRKAVVELQSQIGRLGRSTAAIYGSLSPLVRRREAERFRQGNAEVLVATDAIGLGLNLPIRRLIFAEIEKFDGIATRRLLPSEIRQIAGRAGRYGVYEEGLVTALDPRALRLIRSSIERADPPQNDRPIWISPTDDHLTRLSNILQTKRVSRLLQFFQTRVLRNDLATLRIADLRPMIEVALALELSERFLRLPLATRLTYARAPVVARERSLAIFTRWGEQHALDGTVEGKEILGDIAGRDPLLLFEERSRLATLYLWLAQRFPKVYRHAAEIGQARDDADSSIETTLLQQGERVKAIRHALPPRRKGPPRFDKRRLPR